MVSFVTTILDKFRFQSQVHLSHLSLMDVVVPIRLKFKHYSLSSKWGSRINLSFVGWQDIFNYWVCPSEDCGNCHKRLIPKLFDMISELCLSLNEQLFLRDQLVCFAALLETLCLPAFLPYVCDSTLWMPSVSCNHCQTGFLEICLPTLFAVVLKFFLFCEGWYFGSSCFVTDSVFKLLMCTQVGLRTNCSMSKEMVNDEKSFNF